MSDDDRTRRLTVEDLASDVEGFDARSEPCHVIIKSDDTVQSVSQNAPPDPPLPEVLQALIEAHQLRRAET